MIKLESFLLFLIYVAALQARGTYVHGTNTFAFRDGLKALQARMVELEFAL